MPNSDQIPKRKAAGESQGGAYPNPHGSKRKQGGAGGFLGHGGQSDIGYEGPENPNATTEDQGA